MLCYMPTIFIVRITDTPRRPTVTWAQAEGGKGGRPDEGHGKGIRHEARGAETSGIIWRVAGGDKVQVDDDPLRKKMLGAGERYR